jgi:hypothetical protein
MDFTHDVLCRPHQDSAIKHSRSLSRESVALEVGPFLCHHDNLAAVEDADGRVLMSDIV